MVFLTGLVVLGCACVWGGGGCPQAAGPDMRKSNAPSLRSPPRNNRGSSSFILLTCNSNNKMMPQTKTVMSHPRHLSCAVHPQLPSFHKLIFHTFFNKKKSVNVIKEKKNKENRKGCVENKLNLNLMAVMTFFIDYKSKQSHQIGATGISLKLQGTLNDL